MKHLILALLAVAFSMPALAGKPSKDQIIDNAAPVEATTVKGSKSNSDNVSERTDPCKQDTARAKHITYGEDARAAAQQSECKKQQQKAQRQQNNDRPLK
jgi:hypothetical protein